MIIDALEAMLTEVMSVVVEMLVAVFVGLALEMIAVVVVDLDS
jgi:hypothetical protein